MPIQRATAADAQAISRLVSSLAPAFTLDPAGQGAEGFLHGISPEAICGYVEAANFAYFTGRLNDELAGVVALRDNSHLYHLFVARKFQGQGLARQLWVHARAHAQLTGYVREFTVNSTPIAVPVYEKFGFRATGARVETKGIAYVPMRLENTFLP
jgi:GNAT superfamily N-acetyltransferase